MRQAQILYKDELAGILTQQDDGSFAFRYADEWMQNPNRPSISLTLPKTQQVHTADFLFPFFYNMLPEGSNKLNVCRHHRLDTDDYFGILMTTAQFDTIGAVRVLKIE